MKYPDEWEAGPLPLTFGVELEMVFGIDMWQVNDDPKFQYLVPENYDPDPDDQLNIDDYDPDIDPTSDRLLNLCLAGSILRREGVDLAIKARPKHGDKILDRWSLTHEISCKIPQVDWEINRYTSRSVKDLSFTGIELVSPIMDAPDTKTQQGFDCESFQHLETVLEGLRNDLPDTTLPDESSSSENLPIDMPWVFFSNPKTAGFHVHVGMNHDDDWGPMDIPVKVLQHLAWILVVFEDVISLLHHPERRGFWYTEIFGYAASNRRAFPPPLTPSEMRFGRVKLPLHTCSRGIVYDRVKAFNNIFRTRDHSELRRAMSNEPNPHDHGYRNTFVNFANIAPESGSRHEPIKTVEFRQHCGTTDANEIKEWVYFITSLTRAAERKANESCPPQDCTSDDPQYVLDRPTDSVLTHAESWKYRNIFESKEKRTMKELFDLMELPVERRRYWWAKAQEYQSPTYEEYWKFGTCSPICTGYIPRDGVGWEGGEVIEQPWNDPVDSQAEATDLVSPISDVSMDLTD